MSLKKLKQIETDVSLPQMCKICQPILGNDTLCKSEKECPLLQAAYCAQCASTGHFQKDCKYQVNTIIYEIPCLSPEPRKPILYLRDDPKSVIAFLTKHKLQTIRMKDGLLEESRRKIEEKQKKIMVKYLNDNSVSFEFISTPWTVSKKKYMRK